MPFILSPLYLQSNFCDKVRSVRYKEFVDSHSITQSMSRRGNCYDNAVVESFFGTFKAETIRLYRINTLEQLAEELKDYARYYNRERLKSTLGYKSPFPDFINGTPKSDA